AGGAPASRYSDGTGTQPPLVTDTIFRASRGRCRLTGTTLGSTPTNSAPSSVVTKCRPRAINQSAKPLGLTVAVRMQDMLSIHGATQWIDSFQAAPVRIGRSRSTTLTGQDLRF